MSSIQELLLCNEDLLQMLRKGLPEDEKREAYLADINKLLDNRSTVLMKVDFTDGAVQQQKEQLVREDAEIRKLMAEQQNIIKEDIKRLKAQRQKKKQYANPYQSLAQQDGIFYDKRK